MFCKDGVDAEVAHEGKAVKKAGIKGMEVKAGGR